MGLGEEHRVRQARGISGEFKDTVVLGSQEQREARLK